MDMSEEDKRRGAAALRQAKQATVEAETLRKADQNEPNVPVVRTGDGLIS